MAKDEKRVEKHQQQGQHRRLALGTRNLAGALAADCHPSKELSSVPEPQGTRLAAAVEGNELPRLAEKLPQQKKPKPSSRKSKPSRGGLLASSFSSPSPWHKQPGLSLSGVADKFSLSCSAEKPQTHSGCAAPR